MAVIRKYYMTRNDGMKIFRSYSDKDVYIRKEGTDLTDVEMYDVEGAIFEYVETDVPIEEAELIDEIQQKAAAFNYLTGRGEK